MAASLLIPDLGAKLQTDEQVFQAGDLITHMLEQIDVEYIYGIPGGAIEPLYDAMARSERRGGLRTVVSRHETGSVFMANGYAQQTGKLGVCCATTGPGATNLITGLADAYENHVPVLAITAQTALPTFGRGAFQESSCTGIDTVGMFQYCTRYNSLVSHVDQLPHKLVSAIMTAYQNPMGPVHLSIPRDVLAQPAQLPSKNFDLAKLLRRASATDMQAIQELYDEVTAAKKIVVVVGGECGEAVSAILKFADIFDADIVTTPHGKGLIRADHPRNFGVLGFAGHESARQAMEDPKVDLVIAVETNFSEWASCGWDEKTLLNDRLVHVDSVEENLTRSPMARHHVTGDVLSTFERLLELCQSDNRLKSMDVTASFPTQKTSFTLNDEDKYYSDATPIKPQRLMRELNRLFPANTRFFADTGNSMAWGIHYLQPKDRRARSRGRISGLFRTALEFSSMGWAIGASIGAAMGCNKGPVVCITGDGSFLMNGSELTVAVAERLPVIFVILNDSGLGMVKHGQRLSGAEQVGYEIPKVDYAAIAKAVGAEGYVIESPSDFDDIDIQSMCSRPGPTVLDMRVDPEEVPPMQMRIRALQKLGG
jgi:acetolactate synthase-1/2/3 large subunit